MGIQHRSALDIVSSNKSITYMQRFCMVLLCCIVLIAGIKPTVATADTVAGFIPGELSVGQGGNATYSIPIGVPQGVAGMQPELSINYNSNGGNGLLGMGFSLGGLSAISRCPATFAQDGFKGGIYLNSKDRFCIDGQRLVAVSGSNGANGTEYRTEIDGFSKIISYGQQGSGPSYWMVWTKSGQVMEYGNTSDSKVEVAGKQSVRFWAVNKISDVVSNQVIYNYSEDSVGGHRISEILYNDVSIQFNYQTRTDSFKGYAFGGEIRSGKRLVSIESSVNGQLVKEYKLDYRYSDVTGRSQLLNISECDSDGNCLSPIKFGYAVSTKGLATSSVVTNANRASGVYPFLNERHLQDVDSDGRTDLVYLAKVTNSEVNGITVSTPTVSLYRGKSNGGVNASPITSTLNYCSIYGQDAVMSKLYLADVNADGYLDVVYARLSAAPRICVHFGRSDGKFNSTATVSSISLSGINLNNIDLFSKIELRAKDYNADGYIDLTLVVTLKQQLSLSSDSNDKRLFTLKGAGNGQFSEMSTGPCFTILGRLASGLLVDCEFFDVNGDGLLDAVSNNTTSAGVKVLLSKGDANNLETNVISTTPAGTWSKSSYDRQFLDVNGDGVLDYVLTNLNNIVTYVFLGHGDGRFDTTPIKTDIQGSWLQEDYYHDFADMNGDGIADLLTININNGNTYIFPGKGDGTFTLASTRLATDRNFAYEDYDNRFADINGDGRVDYVHVRKNTGDAYVGLSQYAFEQVSDITDSLGATTAITYKPLTNSSVYTKGSGSSYPNIDLQYPAYVVSKVTTSDGLGGTLSTSYKYGGLKVNVRGRGSLGFAWMEATDNETGIVTKTNYSQSFPYVGQVTSTEQRLSNGTLLGKTTASFNKTTKYSGKVYFPYTEQTVDKKYDLDGTLLATTTTDNVYDAFANPTRITVTTVDSEDTVVKDTLSDYINNTDEWHLGRLTRSSVTHTNGQGSITRTSAFTYNTDGLLSSEIIEPDNHDLRLQTEYDYDSFGNKILVTTSGQGIETRSSSTTYSADGRFPESVTNALGHTEIRTYHPQLGVMTSLTGPNGLTTRWQYDGFGRKIREDRADGTWSTITRGQCGVTACPEDAPIGTGLYTITESSGATPVMMFSDQLGREIRKVTTGFDGTLVYEDIEYNHLGQIDRKSQPYFKGEGSHWASSEYDILGRVKKVSQVGTGGDTIENTFTYSGFSTTSTNAKGYVKTTRKNAQGKVVQVDEEGGGWVTYKYDAIGNLLETNANGVIITLSYDLRGRKRTMDDPDMGQWSYDYDVLGQLTSQTDAKSQTTTIVYDKLGRMVQRVEPYIELDGTSTSTSTATWTYDTAEKGIGKLAQVTGPDGYEQNITYDDLGRASTTTTIADDKTLTTTTEYDSFSRVSRTTRPEGFVLENAYNAQGYLEAVRTPEASIGDYDALHLSQKWSEIEPQLIVELEQAQQKADELYAKAAKYRERAKYYWEMSEHLREQSPNGYRNATIEQLIQTATDLNDLADKLEQKAAEYQQLANAILSLMPTDWQQSWFLNAKARYSQYAQDAIAKIEAAYQENETKLVWIPIDVDGITIFIQGKPGFYGANAITELEKKHLEDIGNAEAGTAKLLRVMAQDVRAQQAARDKYQAAIVDPQNPPLPEDVLTAEELQLYNAPDLLQTDGIALAEFYTDRVAQQQELQRQIEDERTDYARIASRLSQTSAAYTAMITLLQAQAPEAQITFWQATGRDAAGRLTSHIVGNGLETQNIYDKDTGQLTDIISSFGYASPTRELHYVYDKLNNVIEREDRILDMSESFEYDQQDRLTRSYVSGQIGAVNYDYAIDYSYDVMGNMITKSDVTTAPGEEYIYGDQNRTTNNAGPHAMLSAGANHTGYGYDLNGNMLQGGGRTITWSSFNKPIKFEKDGVFQASFNYGPDRSRYLKVTSASRTLYLGKAYERIESEFDTENNPKKIEHKHFVYADGQLVAIHVKTTDNGAAQPDKTRYLHRDSLGSIDTITDGQGNIVDRMSYEPFGARRGGDWRAATGAVYIPALTNRGFTGHEHVDEMDLIHMNGRVYDPQLGRFLSADPTMQFPHSSQGYNRYSYAHNNPLKYTDPSGYFLGKLFKGIKKLFKSITKFIKRNINTLLSLAIMAIPGGQGIGAAMLKGFAAGFVGSGGNLKAGLLGALSAGAFHLAGTHFPGKFENALAHGVIGGVRSVAMGGKFGSGFLSGAFGSVATPSSTNGFEFGGFVQAAVAGGVGSVLGGGKFKNGAITAAFGYAFNAASHSYTKRRLTGAKFYTLEGDIEASLDLFDVDGKAGHEFHIYKGGKEIGVYRDGSFIAKHGFSGDVPSEMTRNALARLNGLDVDMARRMGRLPAKGTGNIKRIFKKLIRVAPVIGPAVTGGMMYNDPDNALGIFSESIGIEAMGDGAMYPPSNRPQF